MALSDPFGLATCLLYISDGLLECTPDNPQNSPVRIPVTSGNNGYASELRAQCDAEVRELVMPIAERYPEVYGSVSADGLCATPTRIEARVRALIKGIDRHELRP